MFKTAQLKKVLFEIVLITSCCLMFVLLFGSFIFEPLVVVLMYITYMCARNMILNKTPKDLFKHVHI